jgi:predicted protein tyrosine phosphatase
MKILFMCNQGKHRSKTAEHLFKDAYQTKSAGLYNETSVTEKQLKWADIVIVMEDVQRTELAKRFPKSYMKKSILSWNIQDIYRYNQPELINLLQIKMKETMPTTHLTAS